MLFPMCRASATSACLAVHATHARAVVAAEAATATTTIIPHHKLQQYHQIQPKHARRNANETISAEQKHGSARRQLTKLRSRWTRSAAAAAAAAPAVVAATAAAAAAAPRF